MHSLRRRAGQLPDHVAHADAARLHHQEVDSTQTALLAQRRVDQPERVRAVPRRKLAAAVVRLGRDLQDHVLAHLHAVARGQVVPRQVHVEEQIVAGRRPFDGVVSVGDGANGRLGHDADLVVLPVLGELLPAGPEHAALDGQRRAAHDVALVEAGPLHDERHAAVVERRRGARLGEQPLRERGERQKWHDALQVPALLAALSSRCSDSELRSFMAGGGGGAEEKDIFSQLQMQRCSDAASDAP
ncbi:hypothetical protein FGB62_29g214 [Gracilaria domingensis]|nr:hypothetical protein FGB62_29g214 [Gracilaria domingensis]